MFVSAVARIAVVGLLMSTSLVYAKGERSVPEAQARAEVMRAVAQNTKILGDMAGGKATFDAAAAAAAQTALAEATGKMASAYEVQGAEDPASEALDNVWSDWDNFLIKVNALDAAAKAVDVASLQSLESSLQGVTGTCRDCHSSYRE